MTLFVHNITDYVAGDSLVLEYTIRAKGGGIPDLTGATFKYGVAPVARRVRGSTLFTKTLGSGIAVTDLASATVRVTVNKGDIPDAGEYYHELEVTLANSESYTPMGGQIMAAQALFPNP